jgi:hypothetical protein
MPLILPSESELNIPKLSSIENEDNRIVKGKGRRLAHSKLFVQ